MNESIEYVANSMVYRSTKTACVSLLRGCVDAVRWGVTQDTDSTAGQIMVCIDIIHRNNRSGFTVDLHEHITDIINIGASPMTLEILRQVRRSSTQWRDIFERCQDMDNESIDRMLLSII